MIVSVSLSRSIHLTRFTHALYGTCTVVCLHCTQANTMSQAEVTIKLFIQLFSEWNECFLFWFHPPSVLVFVMCLLYLAKKKILRMNVFNYHDSGDISFCYLSPTSFYINLDQMYDIFLCSQYWQARLLSFLHSRLNKHSIFPEKSWNRKRLGFEGGAIKGKYQNSQFKCI